jgi:hypothetical protein
MFGILLVGATLLAGGIITVMELSKQTWQKLKSGDLAIVPIPSITVDNTVDSSALQAFLATIVTQTSKIGNVVIDSAKGLGHGTIQGFTPTVTFPLTSVQAIDRNGTRIV